jgi:hypothetical protein
VAEYSNLCGGRLSWGGEIFKQSGTAHCTLAHVTHLDPLIDVICEEDNQTQHQPMLSAFVGAAVGRDAVEIVCTKMGRACASAHFACLGSVSRFSGFLSVISPTLYIFWVPRLDLRDFPYCRC